MNSRGLSANQPGRLTLCKRRPTVNPRTAHRQPSKPYCALGVFAAQTSDYRAKAGDALILQRPSKTELLPEEITDVFNFPRDLKDKYAIGRILGAGSFGVVREATHKETSKRYAVKIIPKTPKNGKPTPRYLLKLQSEVDAMGQLGASLDAVYLKDVFEDDTNVHLVMELCDGGSVLDRLKDGEYSERQVAHIMRSVLRFLAQCHSKGLVYRDVKPENFMLLQKGGLSAKSSGNGNPLWRIGQAAAAGIGFPMPAQVQDLYSPVRATDFGLSIRKMPEDPPLKSRSGTPAYMAPEVIQQEYDESADIWSAGIMMYQLLTGKFPFWDNVRDCTLQQVWKSILTDRINFNANELRQVSEPAKDLLKKMLDRNVYRRITAAEALNHPWLRAESAASALPLRSSVVQRLQRFATYSHLKQLVLRIIADELHDHPSSLPESRALVDALTLLFEELDVDSSGEVSMEELVNGLEKLGYDVSLAELEQLMQRVDTNHDGRLQLPEFVAGLVDWGVLQADQQWNNWVELAFDRLDMNKDGFISLSSLEDLLEYNASEPERALEARRMLREADTNGDGRVSREELCELLKGSSLHTDMLSQYDSRLKTQEGDALTEMYGSLDSKTRESDSEAK